jgi:hypothetical protein
MRHIDDRRFMLLRIPVARFPHSGSDQRTYKANFQTFERCNEGTVYDIGEVPKPARFPPGSMIA